MKSTKGDDYTQRLIALESTWWKRWLNVQAPYRWNLGRLKPGFVLDIGCGVGRNLTNLGGHGVGVDHNSHSVETCRQRGFVAYTPDELKRSSYWRKGAFDSLLISHVLEHLPGAAGPGLVQDYLEVLKPGGRVIIITPQEKGYASDSTHVELHDFASSRQLAGKLGLTVERQYSFPFPRAVGKLFTYNEFVSVLRVP